MFHEPSKKNLNECIAIRFIREKVLCLQIFHITETQNKKSTAMAMDTLWRSCRIVRVEIIRSEICKKIVKKLTILDDI